MKLPDFLIIGAPKSGTTSFYYYLKQHPQVFLSAVKEPNYFCLNPDRSIRVRPGTGPGDDKNTIWISDPREYSELFGMAGESRIAGEASLSYLYSENAAHNIHRVIPRVKCLAILRNPVDRAFSHYCHMLRDSRETESFETALELEQERMAKGWEFSWHYTEVGMYYGQVKRYLDRFPPGQVKIMLYDDFMSRPREFFSEACDFLEIDRGFVPDMSIRHNVSGLPRLRWLNAFCANPNPVKDILKSLLPRDFGHHIKERVVRMNVKGRKPVLSEDTRARLRMLFRDDVLRLQDMLETDLGGWLDE